MEKTIKAEFGSEFQESNATEMLELMLLSWKHFYESRHKNTRIEITDKKNKSTK